MSAPAQEIAPAEGEPFHTQTVANPEFPGREIDPRSIPAQRPAPGSEIIGTPPTERESNSSSPLDAAMTLLKLADGIMDVANKGVTAAEDAATGTNTRIADEKAEYAQDALRVADLLNGPAGSRISILQGWRKSRETAESAADDAYRRHVKAQIEARKAMQKAKDKTLGHVASTGMMQMHTTAKQAQTQSIKHLCGQCSLKDTLAIPVEA